MRYFVKATAFETIIRDEDISVLRERVGTQIKKIRESGKLIDGGILADGRGGVFLLEVDSSLEIFELLGAAIADHFNVESHPLVSFDDLMEFFAKDRAAYASSI